jgi:hypothetical protein
MRLGGKLSGSPARCPAPWAASRRPGVFRRNHRGEVCCRPADRPLPPIGEDLSGATTRVVVRSSPIGGRGRRSREPSPHQAEKWTNPEPRRPDTSGRRLSSLTDPRRRVRTGEHSPGDPAARFSPVPRTAGGVASPRRLASQSPRGRLLLDRASADYQIWYQRPGTTSCGAVPLVPDLAIRRRSREPSTSEDEQWTRSGSPGECDRDYPVLGSSSPVRRTRGGDAPPRRFATHPSRGRLFLVR